MKTVLFILEYFKPHIGGAEVLFDNMISGLTKAGYRVVVLTSKYDDLLPSHERMQYGEHDVEVYRVGHNRYDFMWYAVGKGAKLIKNYQVDLIQTTTFNAAIPSALLRRWTHLPTVLHVHEIYANLRYKFLGWKGFFYKAFEWLIFQFAFDHYTCSSLYTMNSLRLHFGISDEKLTTTYAGIDYNLWDPTTVSTQTTDALKAKYNLQNSFIGLYFGRPGVAKGLSYFLRAVPLISENIPHFKAFLIVPKGEKSSSGGIKSTVSNDEVTQLIDRLGIQEHVIWIDGIPYNQLKEYVMMADVVVLPTLAEGFGLAIAEVCALGRPLVTTPVGSVPEVAGGKVIFVRPGDEKDIARGVGAVFTESFQTVNLPIYQWDAFSSRVLEVYSNIMKGKDICGHNI